MPSYKYHSFQGKDQIRLLNLHPGKGDGRLFGSLFTADLASLPEYETISYVWGDISFTGEVETTEGTIKIYGNLQRALRSLRLEHRPRILWADQISINQDDLQERESQVGIMQKIYGASKCTLVFLGEETQLTSLGAKFFSRLMNDLLKDIHLMKESEVEEAIQQAHLPPPEAIEWKALRSLLTSTWFNRVWTLQEAVVAKDIQFIIGGITIPGKEFIHGIAELSMDNILFKALVYADVSDRVAVVNKSNSICQLRLYRNRWWSSQGIRLAELLQAVAPRGATREVDRLFAMRALASDADDSRLNPDYTSTPEHVFQTYAQFLYEQQSLALLDRAGTSNQILSLPSWVPDWTRTNPALSYRDIPFTSQLPAAIRIDGQQMRLCGVIFDIVKSRHEADNFFSTDNIALKETVAGAVANAATPLTDKQCDALRKRLYPPPSQTFRTVNDRLAAMSMSALPSDWIVFFPGAKHFFTIRKVNKKVGVFKLICQCAIQDMEKDEMMGLYRRNGREIVLE